MHLNDGTDDVQAGPGGISTKCSGVLTVDVSSTGTLPIELVRPVQKTHQERADTARIAAHHGSVTEAEAALGPTQPVRGLGVDWFDWARALTLETQGDVTAAREALSSIWDTPFRYTIGRVSVGPDLTRLHLGTGDRDQAASVAAAVERGASGSDAPSTAGAALSCRAHVDMCAHVRGRLR